MTEPVDWDKVRQLRFMSTAFSECHWIRTAKGLYESARTLEPEIFRVWESYRTQAQGQTTPLVQDHYQGPYFMLLAYAVENLLKAAAVARNGTSYRTELAAKHAFPQKLKEHDLVKLATFVKLVFSTEEEDLLRRLTRSSLWFGRYPVPLKYADLSGEQTFCDGNAYLVSWFGGRDIERLNEFLLSLPKRLHLDESDWERA